MIRNPNNHFNSYKEWLDLEYCMENGERRMMEHGETLEEAGEPAQWIGFVAKGCFKYTLFNARVSYKFLKNKASLILYTKDLFNCSTNNYSDVTATSRTEGGSPFLHHYVSLTFNYKFDAKAGKK